MSLFLHLTFIRFFSHWALSFSIKTPHFSSEPFALFSLCDRPLPAVVTLQFYLFVGRVPLRPHVISISIVHTSNVCVHKSASAQSAYLQIRNPSHYCGWVSVAITRKCVALLHEPKWNSELRCKLPPGQRGLPRRTWRFIFCATLCICFGPKSLPRSHHSASHL